MGKKKNRHKNRNKRKRNRHHKEEKLVMGTDKNPFTQDIPVFVYGTLKQDGSNHDLIGGKHAGASFIGSAITSEAKWAMVSFFKYPGVRGDKKNRIWGELYMVDKLCLEEIDTLENNGKLFQREMIKVTLTEDDSEWDAWMYVMLPNKLGPQDDPDRFEQPGVSQYDYSDDDDTSVDHWEPAPTTAAKADGEAEIEIDLTELEVDPRAPRRFRKVVDREKMKVYYVTSLDGEVVQTLTIDPPKKKEDSKSATTTTSSTTTPSSTGFSGPKPTESTLDYAHRVIAEKKAAEDAAKDIQKDANRYPLTRVSPDLTERPVGQRQPLPIAPSQSGVPAWENPNDPNFQKFHPNAPASFYGRQLGHGGIPEKVEEDPEATKKLYQDAAKNWSDAVKAAVEAAAGESTLADSSTSSEDALDQAQAELDESPSRRWVGHDLPDDEKDTIIYGC